MSDKIAPISIDIRSRNGGRYKSISNLSWNDIPGLAIITGKNGSGKTQLLEAIAYHFSGASPKGDGQLPVDVKVTGYSYEAHEIGFVPSGGRFSSSRSVSLSNIHAFRSQADQHVQNIGNYQHDISKMIRAKRILKNRETQSKRAASEKALLDEISSFADNIDITEELANIFMAYRFKVLESLERQTPYLNEDGSPMGVSPWDIANEALAIAGFSYEITSPALTPILGVYELKLIDRQTGNKISLTDLSSGEKVIMQLVLWLITANKEGVFPKLLLLDEPDAHLHPSMTAQFLDVISEVLVNRYGVRVIMTTHSPSTVALAPVGSVFELERNADAITKVTSRSEVISMLTAGMITVSRATKYCFVEDDDDVDFYESIYEIFTDQGPSKDPKALLLSPSLVFIAASVGTGSTKVSGGSSVVAKWVGKLDADPLDRTFYGIIDRDVSNVSTGRIYAIGRHSFENYLLDPLVIFALLLEEGIAPVVPGVSISSGDEHLLRLQSPATMQAIADVICTAMSAAEPSLIQSSVVSVTYSIGTSINVPTWVIEYRGHDLLQIAQKTFGGSRIVTPPKLRKAMRRCRLVPQELAQLFAAIQAA